MAVRIAQVCGLWFWVAFTFFVFVLLHQSRSVLPSPSMLQTSNKIVSFATRQRMARSEAAWEASVIARGKLASEHPEYPNLPFFPAQKIEDFSRTPYTVWDFFPATYSCPHDIQRVGRLGDGGKWVCGMSLFEAKPAPPKTAVLSQPASSSSSSSSSSSLYLPHTKSLSKKPRQPERHSDILGELYSASTIIYSFGVNDESTFEAEMLARIPSAQIYAFDYSVDSFGPQLSRAASASRAHFSKVGLGAHDEPQREPKFFTLGTLMAQNAHAYIDILKVDIEGGEYAALDRLMDDCETMGALPFGQLLIELHLVDDEHVNFSRFRGWWERLEKFGLRPAWLEINLLAVTLGEGKTDPRCVEYVFVNARDERSVLLGA